MEEVSYLKVHVRKNDTVVVVSGKDKGKTGEVLKVYPKTGKVIVQGVNIVKKHQKPSRANMQGGIVEEKELSTAQRLCYTAQSAKMLQELVTRY